MLSRKFENAARTCDLFFVNSAYTGRDVERTLGVSPAKIHVARPGVRTPFGTDGDASDLGAPYALTVATLEPRKNLETLLEAHAFLADDLLLAVVGAEGWGEMINPLGRLRTPNCIARIVNVVSHNIPVIYDLSREKGISPRKAAGEIVKPRIG